MVTFATFGYGDIQSISVWARLLAGLKAVIGAMLAALLVFVLACRVGWYLLALAVPWTTLFGREIVATQAAPIASAGYSDAR